MDENRELTCIGCPLGCALTVEIQGGEVAEVKGFTCKRGQEYGYKEVTNPTRIVTSTVRVGNRKNQVVSVKTKSDIPKDKIFACIQELKGVVTEAPVRMGDVLIENVAGTGVPVVATKDIP